MLSRDEFASWLRHRVAEAAPAAVVRFGDGEEGLLGADPDDEGSMAVAVGKLTKETGQRFSPDAVLEIKRAIAQAYDEADVLGILFVQDVVAIERGGQAPPPPRSYLERVASGRKPAVLAHGLLSHDIFDTLPELLAGRRISAISCRDVGPVLEGEWGTGDVNVYRVPSQYAVRKVDGAYEAAMHGIPIWPDAHHRIRDELTVREPGEVFLVGAGMFGKDLCVRIRDLGGIGLDLGSALDRLVGKITRGTRRHVLSLHEAGRSSSYIAAQLEDRYGHEIDEEKIRRLTSEESPRSAANPHELDWARRRS